VPSRDRVPPSSPPARRPPEPSPADVRQGAAVDVLELQRGAGNAAVAKLLRKGPEAPRAGGWNETAREVAGTLRIPIDGIKLGNQDEDVGPGSKEGAAGKAIVVVPDGDDLAAGPDVLLFFHGMGNLGYRERLKDDSSRGPAGSVHDVEADRMEQQLAHSGRNIVGILPQGTNAAIFGISDPQAYVTEVLGLAAAKLKGLRPDMKVPATITPGRIIVAGHSGGGRAAVSAAKTLNATTPASDDEWAKSPPLFLFDGLNGPIETNGIGDLMDQWLQADLLRLKAAKDPDKLLDRRGIKLRSTHTNSALYTATNLGGTYETEKGTVTIAKGRSTRPTTSRASAPLEAVATANDSSRRRSAKDATTSGSSSTTTTNRSPIFIQWHKGVALSRICRLCLGRNRSSRSCGCRCPVREEPPWMR